MHGRLKVRSTKEQQEAKNKERQEKLKKYDYAMNTIFDKRDRDELDSDMMNLTSAVLAANPDITTLWNIRKDSIIRSSRLDSSLKNIEKLCSTEQFVTESCLKINPKSYNAWAHRSWLLETLAMPNNAKVTRDTSNSTPDTSNVTLDTSNVTPDTSNVTPDTSNVITGITDTSKVTPDVAQVTGDTRKDDITSHVGGEESTNTMPGDSLGAGDNSGVVNKEKKVEKEEEGQEKKKDDEERKEEEEEEEEKKEDNKEEEKKKEEEKEKKEEEDTQNDFTSFCKRLWHVELCLCDKFLEYDERNFHCWDHRRVIVAKTPFAVSVDEELLFTDRKIAANFSNFSSWHYRSKLLLQQRRTPPPTHDIDPQPVVDFAREFSLIENAAYTDPDDQSIWFYHRWLINLVNTTNPVDADSILEHEISWCLDLLELEPDNKWLRLSLIGMLKSKEPDVKARVQRYICDLKTMDPLRINYYVDLEKKLKNINH